MANFEFPTASDNISCFHIRVAHLMLNVYRQQTLGLVNVKCSYTADVGLQILGC